MLVSPLARSLCQPLAVPLTGASGILADPAADAYIADVETAKGSAVTPGQRAAITAFIRAEKSAARWDLHKRLYLPIWGEVDANAICLRSLTTGTFVGGTTHGAGFVQSDGTSGYFNLGASASTLGQTTASLALSFLSYGPDSSGTRAVISAYQSDPQQGDMYATASNLIFIPGATSSSATLALADQTGILIGSREGGQRRIHRRSSSAFSTPLTSTAADSGSVPTVNYQVMRSLFGGGSAYTVRQLGSFGFHMGLTTAAAEGFSANLKTLWETCTGLTLPA